MTSRQHYLAITLLLLSGIALWTPSWHAISLNPDESQYEATASYLVATETSAFLPNGAPGTFGLFKIMTWLFGAYPTLQMRVLITLLAIGIAYLLFRAVTQAAGWGAGLFSSLVYLHLLMRFEGLAVNREWFAVAATVGGLSIFLLALRVKKAWPFFFAGFVCGLALWFKLQVAYIVFVAPLTLVLLYWRDRTTVRFWPTLLPFAAGGISAGLLYLSPFALQGTLGQFLEFMFSDIAVFVGENETVIQSDSGGSLLWPHFVADLPYRPFFLIAYAFGLTTLAMWLFNRRDTTTARPATLLFAFYLILSAYSVQMGHRFFDHYYQLMLPAVAALVGLAVGWLWARRDRWSAIWAIVAILVIAFERYAAVRSNSLWFGKLRWPEGHLTIVMLVLSAVAIVYWLRRPERHATRALIALLGVQAIFLIATEQLAPAPGKVAFPQSSYPALRSYMAERAQPTDRLFVWGWAPEIYSWTRLEAASHLTFCQYVANDLKGVPDRPRLNEEWAALLMDELREAPPRFILDAASRSWFETEETIYQLSNFPNFELNRWLLDDYRRTQIVDGVVVWERRLKSVQE